MGSSDEGPAVSTALVTHRKDAFLGLVRPLQSGVSAREEPMKPTRSALFVSIAAAGLLVSSVADAKPKARARAPQQQAQAQIAAPVHASPQVASSTAAAAAAKPAPPEAPAIMGAVAAGPVDPLEAALARAANHAAAAPAQAAVDAVPAESAMTALRDQTRAATALELLDRNRDQTMPVGEVVEHFKVQPLDQKTVARVIHTNARGLQHCHASLTARGKRCDGDTSLRFTIDPRGAVSSVVVHASGADAAALERCIAASVKTWKFPAAAAPTDVDYPLVFETAR